MPDTTPTPTPVTGTGIQQAPVPPAQAPGLTGAGAVAINSVAAVLLGVAVWYVIKHKKANTVHVLLAVGLGLTLSGSVLGRALGQVIVSLISALVGVTGSL